MIEVWLDGHPYRVWPLSGVVYCLIDRSDGQHWRRMVSDGQIRRAVLAKARAKQEK
jgi:hypothetical protein